MSNMFQGWKKNLDSFLDSKIADEQAKQAQQSSSSRPSSAGTRRTPSSAAGAARRSSARTESPRNKRTSSRLRVQDGDLGALGKGPDPDDFVIGDDASASDISRVGTPAPVKEEKDTAEKEDAPVAEVGEKKDGGAGADEVKSEVQQDGAAEKGKAKQVEETAAPSATSTEQELPEDVRKKLAKLEALTAKYQDLLRNYRTAHARVAAIEPFEATLREHTPLTSIIDPGALVEFLNQRGLQSEMVMEELKRISHENREIIKERDELETKLEDAEKKAKDAFDEAAGLKEEREKQADAKKQKDAVKSADEGDEFFSFDAEQPRLEAEAEQHRAELQEQKDYIDELSTENAALRTDLETTKLDLNAMRNKVGVHEREITGLKAELVTAKEVTPDDAQMQTNITAERDSLIEENAKSSEKIKDLSSQLSRALEQLYELKTGQAENAEKLKKEFEVQSNRKDEIGRGVMDNLRSQLRNAETVRDKALEAQQKAEGSLADLRLAHNILTSEAGNREINVERLKANEAAMDAYKKRALDAEAARDVAERLAESKKGHEAAAASLRAQLKDAVKDRDKAYQMVIQCSRCSEREKEALINGNGSRSLEVDNASEIKSRSTSPATSRQPSTLPTEVSTPAAEVDEGEATGTKETKASKKRNKKKAKKTAAGAAADEGRRGASESSDTLTTGSIPTPASVRVSDLRENESLADISSLPEDVDMANQGETSDTTHANDLLNIFHKQRQETQQREAEKDSLQLQHEQLIAERTAKLQQCKRQLREKEEECETMRTRISELEVIDRDRKREDVDLDELREENETLKESLADVGAKTTGAMQQASDLREQKQRLEAEVEELQQAQGKTARDLREARTQIESFEKQTEAERANSAELESLTERLTASQTTVQALQLAKEACEKQIEEMKAQTSANGAELDARNVAVAEEFEQLRTKASELESDLAASAKLAQERFDELSKLKEHVNANLTPEIKKLRAANEKSKDASAELEKKKSEVGRLEDVERGLRKEVGELKTQVGAKDGEVTKLKAELKKSEARASALEDSYSKTRTDIEALERTRDAAVEEVERLKADLKTVQEDLKNCHAHGAQLESQLTSFRDDIRRAQEALEMKTAQHASAQSLVGSLQDQSRELATQVKEVGARNEGLEDELADVRRALQERGQEGQTMRRLISDAETRADAKVREMRERLDIAVEERDRAEEEASSVGRRRGREVEDLKSRVREADAALHRAREERSEAERRERTFKERLEELEGRGRVAREESDEVKQAMAQLRDTLDESEALAARLEKDKIDLRTQLDEREARLEKLQKSGKNMAEEIRTLKSARSASTAPGAPSSRSSLESSRVASPRPGSSGLAGTGAAAPMDYVYLKNVLLQFLEQKEKRNQQALVPVLGRLLHFDQADERRWEAAVAGR